MIGVIVFGVAIFFVLAQFMDGRVAFLIGIAFVIVVGVAQRRRQARRKAMDGLGLTDEEARQLQEYARKGDREATLQLITSAQARQRASFHAATGVDLKGITPEVGRDISWADIINHVFHVLEFDRVGTAVDRDDHVRAGSPTRPYGYLLVESSILNQQARLPIVHRDDFLLAASVFDEPGLVDMVTTGEAELLVTYAPERLLPGGLTGSPFHVLHYVLAPRGSLDSYYSENDDAHMANPDPEELFGPFVYEGEISVRMSPELKA
jgi:hypothetical protein